MKKVKKLGGVVTIRIRRESRYYCITAELGNEILEEFETAFTRQLQWKKLILIEMYGRMNDVLLVNECHKTKRDRRNEFELFEK